MRGETWDCLAMTEPGAGSDLRGMQASARPDGGDRVLNGTTLRDSAPKAFSDGGFLSEDQDGFFCP